MTQNTVASSPDRNNGLSPDATQQVLNNLTAGLEDLGDALTLLLPLFRSLAYGDSRYGTEDLRAELAGGDSDLILSIYDCWTNPTADPQTGLALLQVLFRSTALREKAELQQRLESQEPRTIPLTWHTGNPLESRLTEVCGDAALAELAIDKAQQAQMFLFKAKAILERATDSPGKQQRLDS